MRFTEEQKALAALLKEWYAGIEEFTEVANGVFSDKAKQYDRISPVWHRIEWPGGFVQELRKKTDRLTQLLANYNHSLVDSYKQDAIEEELVDIINYSRMMAAIGRMFVERNQSG
jgi:hypothetical protein